MYFKREFSSREIYCVFWRMKCHVYFYIQLVRTSIYTMYVYDNFINTSFIAILNYHGSIIYFSYEYTGRIIKIVKKLKNFQQTTIFTKNCFKPFFL